MVVFLVVTFGGFRLVLSESLGIFFTFFLELFHTLKFLEKNMKFNVTFVFIC